MTYTAVRSGFTGPSAHIGGSSDYHIDLKLNESLPIAQRVNALDALARQYKSIGREIEFSNQNVGGARWNLEADLSDKVDLLNRAAGAHAPRPGWQSVDFYVPFAGKSRFDAGAVEGASIYVPAIAGGKVRRGSGGDYGYFSEALSPSGEVLFRVGHGDVRRPEDSTEVAVAGGAVPPSKEKGAEGGAPGSKEFLEAAIGTILADAVVGGKLKPPGMPEAKKKDKDENGITRDELYKLQQIKNLQTREQERERIERQGLNQFLSAVDAAKSQMARASALAQQSFRAPGTIV